MNKMRAKDPVFQSSPYLPTSFVEEHSDSVYRFCRGLTFSKEDAEDLFQETFLRALEHPDKIIQSPNPQGFLFTTALFLWKSWKRKYARRKRLVPLEPLTEHTESPEDMEDRFLIQEENRMVREQVNRLPEKFKIPIILYYSLELGIPEIAKALSLPTGTVKSRLYKARKLIEKGLVELE